MNGLNYRLWRNGVYEKDEYTCQVCGQVNGNLNAHHIKEYAKYPELRYEISNGVTLCKKCHILYHQADREYIKRMEQEVAI
jgi:5-methylcytosine-specific restriction endonuclease McrA